VAAGGGAADGVAAAVEGAAAGAGGVATRATGDVLHVVTQWRAAGRAAAAGVPRCCAVRVAAKRMANPAAASLEGAPRFQSILIELVGLTGPPSA